MKCCHDIESADFGHKQVEYDQVRHLSSCHLDRVGAAVGAQHLASQAVDVQGDQLYRARVVVHDQDLQASTLCHWNQTEFGERVVKLLP